MKNQRSAPRRSFSRTSVRPSGRAAPIEAKDPTWEAAFQEVWAQLFRSPIHLDSLLSKQTPKKKSLLAQLVPAILLRPVALAEVLGVGINPGEPWDARARPSGLTAWKPSLSIARRLHQALSGGGVDPDPTQNDIPPEMWEELAKDWTEAGALKIVKWLCRPAPLSVRISRRENRLDARKLLLETKGVAHQITPSLVSPQGLEIGGYAPVFKNELYERGGLEIQDVGSQLMAFFALWPERYASLLAPSPVPRFKQLEAPALPEIKGEWAHMSKWTVIDACAGAGGKTLALADALSNRAKIFAYDVSEKKLLALRRRATHAQLTNIKTLALQEGAEASAVGPHAETADLVLVDAPCSGWGVLRRNPDIKWRQTPEALARMSDVQMRVLNLYAGLVKPGGRLVYGTCTFRKAETTEISAAFLKEHPEFEAKEGGFIPGGAADGFYMQSFTKKGGA